MNEKEIRELLKKHGYELDKIVRFKKSDRLRWHSKDLKVSINLGRKIEDISKDYLLPWILSKKQIARLKMKHHELIHEEVS